MRRKFLGFIMALCFAVSSLPVNSSAFEASAGVLPEYDFNAAKNVNGFIAPVDDPDASAVKIKYSGAHYSEPKTKRQALWKNPKV